MSEATTVTTEAVARARARVNAGFADLIGNDEAIYSVKRPLVVALARTPDGQMPVLPRAYLLSGAPSTGKTAVAKRVADVLGVPFVRLDGRAVKSRERLFEMIDDALAVKNLRAQRDGDRAGTPILRYPAFGVFIDEVHLVPERLQEAFLTMLEADDRELLLNGERGRRLALVDRGLFVFATTRPADLDRAFRSRCIEIPLQRYTADEVTAMVRARFPTLPIAIAEAVATISRLSPRQAFALAQEVIDETIISDDGAGSTDMKACLKRVMDGRGILFVNGATRIDLRYLDVLDRARRPMGESAIQAALHDVDPSQIRDDVEPYLLSMDYIGVSPKGRQITMRGVGLLEQVRETGMRVNTSTSGNAVRVSDNAAPIRVRRGTYVQP